MIYHPSLSEKVERLRQLRQQVNNTPMTSKSAATAILLADLRWEMQEIKDVKTELHNIS
jgi:hypothetical protein